MVGQDCFFECWAQCICTLTVGLMAAHVFEHCTCLVRVLGQPFTRDSIHSPGTPSHLHMTAVASCAVLTEADGMILL